MVLSVGTVDGAKRRQTRQRRQIEVRQGFSYEPIWDSGLVEKDMSYATLLEKGREYYGEVETRRFNNFVLAYVTPWNRDGYENAVIFRHRLDAVSPVWFQIKQQEGHKAPDIVGGHDVNQTWIAQLREGGKGPLVVPRFIIEAEPLQHVEMLQAPQALLEGVMRTIVEHDLDGMVLETWVAWQNFNGLANDQFRRAAMNLIAALGKMLHDAGKKFYLAMPPLFPVSDKSQQYSSAQDLTELAPHVDAFSVMTYDYSTARGRPGPNAPMDWILYNVLMMEGGSEHKNPPYPEEVRKRILLGLNFYGWDFAPSRGGLSAVTANELMPLLQRHQPKITWWPEHEEHSFEYKDKEGHEHQVWYPTPRSVELRIQVAKNYNIGLSIWELGQGLERFFDLL